MSDDHLVIPMPPVATTRRSFLLQCSAVVAIATVPTSVALSAAAKIREVSLDRIGFSTFDRLVGTRFRVYGNAGIVTLELVEATASHERRSARGVRKSEPDEFSLIFEGPKSQPLDQNTYAFLHEQIGGFAMFIVPVWDLVALTGVRHYEAVFNRFTEVTT
jgi:hypothetical protein